MDKKPGKKHAFRVLGIAGIFIGALVLVLSTFGYLLLRNAENSGTYGVMLGASVAHTEVSYYYYLIGISLALVAISSFLFLRNGGLTKRKRF